MSDFKDSAIKLFGKTIPLSVVSYHHHRQQPLQEILANDQSSSADDHGSCDRNPETSLREENFNKELQEEQEQGHEEHSGKEIIEDKEEDGSSKQTTEDLKDSTTSSGNTDHNPKTPSVDRETSSLKSSKNGEQSETITSQEKTLKKPVKILPCPRCNSMDTKFCYYNNYNVNQPRHFCKNCQRYWTAGGTMRSVPVGAGRRKNKSSSVSHFRQIVISEALRSVQSNGPNGIHNPSFGNNGTVLTFGSDLPLCESVASALITDKTQNCVRNGFHKPEQRSLAFPGGRDNRDDQSNGSSIGASNSSEKGGNSASQDVRIKNYQDSAPQLPYFPGPPWPYPWNTPMPPPPAFCHSGFPISFYPETTYWGCTVPGPWNMPCFSPNSSSRGQYPPSSSSASPALGKHSRDGNIITPTNSEKEEPSRGSSNTEISVLVPKTLRIDDPSEAAKSSIWATLGIKNEKANSGEGLFRGFQSKSDHRNCITETSAVLQANPAALSRSLSFHETP